MDAWYHPARYITIASMVRKGAMQGVQRQLAKAQILGQSQCETLIPESD